MRKDNPFAGELIRQEGFTSDQRSDADRQALRAHLELQMKRTRRMKRVTIGSWILVAMCAITLGLFDIGRHNESSPWIPPSPWIPAASFAFHTLVIIAIFMTISYYLRHRAATQAELRMRLAEIEAKLQQIANR